MRLRKDRYKKKGSIQDVPYLLVILFALAISIFVGAKVWLEIDDSSLGDSQEKSSEIMSGFTHNVLPTWDYWMLIVFSLGTVVTAILAFLIRTHPAFFPASMIFLGIIVFVAYFISVAWGEFSEEDAFAEEMDRYPITNFIASNFAILTLLMGAIILIAMYAFNKIEFG